jgi:hypothetical protein
MHAVALRNRGQRFASSASLDRFGSLVLAQLAFAAEFDAGGHSALAAFATRHGNSEPNPHRRVVALGRRNQQTFPPVLSSFKAPVLRQRGGFLFFNLSALLVILAVHYSRPPTFPCE